jgi:hypothetical protein
MSNMRRRWLGTDCHRARPARPRRRSDNLHDQAWNLLYATASLQFILSQYEFAVHARLLVRLLSRMSQSA